MNHAAWLGSIFFFSVMTQAVHAATPKSPDLFKQPVKISTDELLSMPADNRRLIAKSRGAEFVSELETRAFDQEESFGVRWKAFILAAQIRAGKSESLLKKGFKSKEWFMRNAALVAATDVNPRKAKEMAVDLLNDKALVVRSAAVSVLSAKLDDDGREALWEQLENKNNYRKKQGLFIRSQILQILAKDPLKKELPLFVRHLKSNDERMHPAAIVALEKVTSKKIGSSKDSLNQKRSLWVKWATASGSF